MKKINYLGIGMLLSCGALFTACSDDDNLGAVNITVEEAYNIESDIFGIDVTEGEPLQLKPFIMPESARESKVSYRFAGEPTGAIDLSEDGVITPLLTTPPAPEPIPEPLGSDTIVITVEDGSGTYVVYPVRVISNIVVVSSITIQSAGQTVEAEKGMTFNLAQYVTVNPSNATDSSVTYTSDDESVATVDQNGVITITGEVGQSTYIHVTANDRGKATATCTVKVADEAPLYMGVPYDGSWAVTCNLGTKEGSIDNLFDDDNSTYWCPDIQTRPLYDPQAYLDIDFGKVIKFGQIGYRHRGGLNYQWLQCHTFTLQGKLAESDEWIDLGEFVTEKLKPDDYQLFQIETPVEIQYLRINFIKGHLRDGYTSWDEYSESGNVSVGDLQFYEYNR